MGFASCLGATGAFGYGELMVGVNLLLELVEEGLAGLGGDGLAVVLTCPRETTKTTTENALTL